MTFSVDSSHVIEHMVKESICFERRFLTTELYWSQFRALLRSVSCIKCLFAQQWQKLEELFSYLQLVLINPDIKYPLAYLFSWDKKNSLFCLSFVYTLELINKKTYVSTKMLIFHLKERGKKKIQNHTLSPSSNSGGGKGLLSRGRGGGGINGLLSHPSSYLNPSPLSRPPFPLPHYESVLFFMATISKQASEIKGNFNVVFWFHFWHLLITNLNGYQGQTSAYLPAPSYQVLMQMRPICYL